MAPAFANPLVATVTDQFNNPVSGVTVTFTAPATGASGTFAPPRHQDLDGRHRRSTGLATSSTFTANTAAGAYNVTASATGHRHGRTSP